MVNLSFSPKEVTEYVVDLGKQKIDKKLGTLMVQGIMAGMFISFGAVAFINIFSNTLDTGIGLFLASAIFPVGIIAILLLGFELVTGNVLIMMGVYDKRYKLLKVLKMLGIVWVANLIGTLLIAFAVDSAGIFTPQMAETLNVIGEAKVDMSYYEMFMRGVLCNMLVCAGVMMALTAKDNISKMAAIWLPIVVFIFSRLEHIVANMYFLPMSYLTGADITILEIINSFIFVSIGNFIGGAIVIGGAMYLTQLKKQKS